MVDAGRLKRSAERLVGSSPTLGTSRLRLSPPVVRFGIGNVMCSTYITHASTYIGLQAHPRDMTVVQGAETTKGEPTTMRSKPKEVTIKDTYRGSIADVILPAGTLVILFLAFWRG